MEQNEKKITDSYSPLSENVQEKRYAAQTEDVKNNVIPEAQFVPPSFAEKEDFFAIEDEKNGTNHKPPIQPSYKHSPIHDEPVNQLSDIDKKRAAEAMASTFIQGYSLLCKQGAKWVMIKPGRVTKLIREGKINPDILYYAPGNVQATAPEIIQAYNNEMSEIMEVSEDFVDQVRPLLVRIFTKRGIGMSDEAQLCWIVGQDVFMKGSMLLSIKKQSNDFIKSFSTGVNNSPLEDHGLENEAHDESRSTSQPEKEDDYYSGKVKSNSNKPIDLIQEDIYGNKDDYISDHEENPLKKNDYLNNDVIQEKEAPLFGNPNNDMLDKIDELSGTNKTVKRKRGRPKKK